MKAFAKGVLGLSALAMTATALQAQPYEVVTRSGVEYVEHDGVKLAGDLYLPKGLAKAPILIAVHGGGWQAGSRVFYRHWGPYLAKHGFGVFAISYRFSKPGVKSYPEAVYDVKAAIQFTRANAAQLSIDPERIGLIGDSAGAHLASLVALAGDDPQFSTEYRNAPHALTPTNVKVGDRILRRLRHGRAMGSRPDHAAARPDHREVHRRAADGEPAGLFRRFADQLRDHRQERKDPHALSSDLRNP